MRDCQRNGEAKWKINFSGVKKQKKGGAAAGHGKRRLAAATARRTIPRHAALSALMTMKSIWR